VASHRGISTARKARESRPLDKRPVCFYFKGVWPSPSRESAS
jgi:hypothetical protein